MVLRVIFFYFVLLFSTSSFAETCLCPEVQCEPCQQSIVLGTEELSCGVDAKISCKKVVCENVDNFFQCLSGAPPVHAMQNSQNLQSKITEPRDPAEYIPEPIDFRKFKKELLYVEDKIEITPEKTRPAEKKEIVRQPASFFPKQVTSFQISSVTGKVEVNKKRLQKPVTVQSAFSIKAKEKSEILVKGPQSDFKVKMTAGAEWLVRMDLDVLWLEPLKGEVVVTLHKTELVHALDMGMWRLAKREGVYGISRQQNTYTLLNEKGPGYLRRNELISQAIPIEPQKLIQLSAEEGVIAFRDINYTPVAKPKYEMPMAVGFKGARGIASDGNLCSFPAGQFENCAWKCFGASTKDKKCGQSKNSQCIRFTCSADGLWKLPTGATPTECDRTEVRVGACQ
jgi:hypothetical protein